MQHDEALQILRNAGYTVQQVAADQWRITLAGYAYATTTVHGAMLRTLAAAISRSEQASPRPNSEA